MKYGVRLTLATLLLWTLSEVQPAFAAHETEVVPYLHGQVGLQYHNKIDRSKLFQYGVEVGTVQEGEAGPAFEVRFGVFPGVELFSSIPIVSGSRSSQVSAMCGDTTHTASGKTEYGSTGQEDGCTLGDMVYVYSRAYVPNGEVADPIEYAWSGMDDVLLGVRFAPFSESNMGSLQSKREKAPMPFPPMATWRVELGYRINTGQNFYLGGPGAGSGGLRLGTSFSKRIGEVAEPYFSLVHDRYSPYSFVGTSPMSGQSIGGDGVLLSSPNMTQIFFGVELSPYRDATTEARFSVDFAGGTWLTSESSVLSGSRLAVIVTDPNAGEANTQDDVVVEQGQAAFVGRLRLTYQLIKWITVQGSGTLGYTLSHRLEDPYSVEMGAHLVGALKLSMNANF
ncbi:MAG: hypothetical protein ACKO6N_21915 [Myxococcota bacterium]